MRNFIAEHRKNISKKRDMLKGQIAIGQIITFRYNKSENNKNPTVLVLNDGHNGLLHGLVIDYMETVQLKELEKYVLNEVKEKDPDSKTGFQVSLRKLSIDNPELFYETRLKHFLKNNIKSNVYRTYELDEITNVKLVTYNF